MMPKTETAAPSKVALNDYYLKITYARKEVEGFELDFISISEGNQELLEAITSE